MQPRHRPNANSRNAAPISAPTTICAASPNPSSDSTNAVPENARPMVCAKRFGGPGTVLVFFHTCGTITCTARRPKGE